MNLVIKCSLYFFFNNLSLEGPVSALRAHLFLWKWIHPLLNAKLSDPHRFRGQDPHKSDYQTFSKAFFFFNNLSLEGPISTFRFIYSYEIEFQEIHDKMG